MKKPTKKMIAAHKGGKIDITVIDEGRLNAIASLARMGEALAMALNAGAMIDISNCYIDATGAETGIRIQS